MKTTFAFLKKKIEGKKHSAFVLQQTMTEAVCTLSIKSGTAKLLPQQLHLAPQHQANIDLKCL